MGAGSSVQDAVTKASPEEIKAAVCDLSLQDVKKVQAALQGISDTPVSDKFVVPEKVSMCDERWFTNAFRKAGLINDTMSVTSIDMKILGADQGLTSDTALVELAYQGGESSLAPQVCCVKMPDRSTKLPKEMIQLMFQAEIDIYRHMSADFASKGMILPRLYFAACPDDPATEGYVMVLEHMTHPARQPSFQVGSIAEGVPMECALFAVKELAGLHAAYWNMCHQDVRALETAPGKPKFPQATFAHVGDAGKKTWYATSLKQRVLVTTKVFGPDGTAKLPAGDGAVEGFRDLGSIVSTFERTVTRRLGVFLKRLLACPVALTHGDSHAENLFIRPAADFQPGAAMWFDFGTLAFRPAAWDLALFVISSLEPDVRAAQEEKLALCYHNALLSKGINDYTFAQCLSDYRFCACAGFWNIGGLIVARKEVLANEKFPVRPKANILTKRVAAALAAAKWEDFFKDGPEDSEEQNPVDAEKPLNFE